MLISLRYAPGHYSNEVKDETPFRNTHAKNQTRVVVMFDRYMSYCISSVTGITSQHPPLPLGS